jgi:hypothetical protein
LCILCIIQVSKDKGVSVHKAKVGEQLRRRLKRQFKGAVKGVVEEAVQGGS